MGKMIALPNSEQYQFPRVGNTQPNEALTLEAAQPEYHQDIQTEPAVPPFPDTAVPQALTTQGETPTWNSPISDRETLRLMMVAHSKRGSKLLKKRSKFIGEIEQVTSPSDPEVSFGIKRIGTREMIAYRNRNSKVSYITRSGDSGEEYITERSFPAGDGEIDTIYLCLARWDLADENNIPIPITHESIQDYLSPEEVDFLFTESHRVNPILLGADTQKKTESTTQDATGSADGGDESPAVHPLVPVTAES
jgi:hypothetical protein